MATLITLAVMACVFALCAWLIAEKDSIWRYRTGMLMSACGAFVFVVAVVAIFM